MPMLIQRRKAARGKAAADPARGVTAADLEGMAWGELRKLASKLGVLSGSPKRAALERTVAKALAAAE